MRKLANVAGRVRVPTRKISGDGISFERGAVLVCRNSSRTYEYPTKDMRLLIFTSVLFLCGCATNDTVSTAIEPFREVTLLRTPGEGTSPYYQVSIRSDGSVIYEGKAYVAIKGIRTKKITPARFAVVWEKLEEINFWSLKERYDSITQNTPNGNQVVILGVDYNNRLITVVDGDKKKTVSDSFGAPQSLQELANIIDTAAGISVWIYGQK